VTWNRRLTALALLAGLLLWPSLPASSASDPRAQTDDLLTRINRARLGAGVLPLARAAELDTAAQGHSADMVAHDYLDHTGSDGSEPQQRAEQAGYKVPPQSGWIVVEVISAISGDPEGPLNWWLGESDQHRSVLLNPRWREIGLGYAEGGEYGHYWTADFGCRPGILPSVTLDGSTYTPTEQCGDPQSAAALAPTVGPASTVAPTLVPSMPAPTLVPPTVAPTSGPPLTLVVSPEVAAAGDSVNVRWSGLSTPKGTDWIGLYRSGAVDRAYMSWSYVGCAPIPLDARALGSCNLALPRILPHGTYEFRLFRDNDYTPVRTSSAVQVS
jgi:hypothetical protein